MTTGVRNSRFIGSTGVWVGLFWILSGVYLPAGDLTTDNLTVRDSAEIWRSLKVGVPEKGAAPTNGLLLYYSFDTDTVPVPDDSGNTNTATVVSAAWISAGVTGGAYDFDGTNSIIYGSTVNNLPIGGAPKTLCTWFKADAYVGGIIIKHGAEASARGQCMQFVFSDAGGGSYCLWLSGYLTDLASVGRFVTNTWYHVCVTFASGSASIYINGAFDKSGAFYQNIPANMRLTVGCNPESPGARFNGKVDEVRLYNRVLSPQEIRDLYLHDADFIAGDVLLKNGVKHMRRRGDVSMGTYTNTP